MCTVYFVFHWNSATSAFWLRLVFNSRNISPSWAMSRENGEGNGGEKRRRSRGGRGKWKELEEDRKSLLGSYYERSLASVLTVFTSWGKELGEWRRERESMGKMERWKMNGEWEGGQLLTNLKPECTPSPPLFQNQYWQYISFEILRLLAPTGALIVIVCYYWSGGNFFRFWAFLPIYLVFLVEN